MNNLFSILFLLFGVFISSISQILLKKSTKKSHLNILKEYLNPNVIVSYSIFLVATLISVFSFRYLRFATVSVIESASYIFIPILSRVFFNEKANKKQMIGFILIIVGIFIFTIF